LRDSDEDMWRVFPAAAREGADIVLIRPMIGRPRGCKRECARDWIISCIIKGARGEIKGGWSRERGGGRV